MNNEYYLKFRSLKDWENWKTANKEISTHKQAMLSEIESRGYIEPITNIHRDPEVIKINKDLLHETISSEELNSRKRALLVCLFRSLNDNGLWPGRRLRILSADGVSRIALILRGIFPFFWGAEYLPTEADRNNFFPVPHMDLQNIDFSDNQFDAFISGDVFEHVPDLDTCLSEIARVLKPGGILISSFPFSPRTITTVKRAELKEDGEIRHILPPEYHGNPVDVDAGSLVFNLPGWDILDQLRKLGFDDVYFQMIASEKFGILSDGDALGPFVLVAEKSKN